jgi:hypothetical protein
MIIERTCHLLKSKYGDRFEVLSISGMRMGIYLTTVRLSDGSTGVYATLAEDQPFYAKSKRDFGDFTPLKIRGKK